MPQLTITTKYQLKAWLEENGWFEVGNVLNLSPLPSPVDEERNAAPNTVTFRLDNCIYGGIYAGDVLEFNSYLINASGVTTWSCSEAWYIADPDNANEYDLELDE